MRMREFWHSTQGNFGMMFALTLPVMLASVGLAIDVGTMTQAHSKLQNAVDAAVLAASRIHDKDVDREEVFKDFLNMNIADDPVLGSLQASLDIDRGINYISTKGSVRAEVQLYFPMFFGGSREINVFATAYESRDNLEVVVALDNTGSMGAAGMSQLRTAATSLIDILSTVHAPDAEPKRVVKAALVPFVTAVNVKGEGYKDSWIDGQWDPVTKKYRTPVNSYHGVNFVNKSGSTRYNHFELFDYFGKTNGVRNIDWKGCVEARPAPYNLSDDAPDPKVGNTMFVPYFAPDEPGNAVKPADSGTLYNNTYLNDAVSGSDRDKQRSAQKYIDYNPSGSLTSNGKYILNGHASATSGPNYACPTPIVPLTSDFAKLKAEIGKMIHWLGSGTNVSEGLAWSYRVLSPGEPYTQGTPFKSENTSKFVVVFTDGENNVFGASSQSINKSDYGSYNFVDQNRFGTTDRGKALTQVNTWTQTVCTNLKAQGVEIFTVLLGADSQANRNLYSNCATTPENYYPTSDVSQLDVVFRKIASRIAKLYVTG